MLFCKLVISPSKKKYSAKEITSFFWFQGAVENDMGSESEEPMTMVLKIGLVGNVVNDP